MWPFLVDITKYVNELSVKLLGRKNWMTSLHGVKPLQTILRLWETQIKIKTLCLWKHGNHSICVNQCAFQLLFRKMLDCREPNLGTDFNNFSYVKWDFPCLLYHVILTLIQRTEYTNRAVRFAVWFSSKRSIWNAEAPGFCTCLSTFVKYVGCFIAWICVTSEKVIINLHIFVINNKSALIAGI